MCYLLQHDISNFDISIQSFAYLFILDLSRKRNFPTRKLIPPFRRLIHYWWNTCCKNQSRYYLTYLFATTGLQYVTRVRRKYIKTETRCPTLKPFNIYFEIAIYKTFEQAAQSGQSTSSVYLIFNRQAFGIDSRLEHTCLQCRKPQVTHCLSSIPLLLYRPFYGYPRNRGA